MKIVQRITSHNGIYTTVTENNEKYMPVRITVTDMNKHSFVTVSKYDTKRNLVASQDYRGMVTLNEYTENGQIKCTRSYYSESFNTAITHNGFEYLFEYDGFGRQTKIIAGGDMLAKTAYTLTDTTTVTTTYANSDSLTVTTDCHQAPMPRATPRPIT